MTNESRGEVDVVLDGKTWTMRPDFQTLRAIEHKAGMSALKLIRVIGEGAASLDHIVTVLELGLKAANDDAPGFDQIGEMVVRQGVSDLLPPILVFLGSVAVGDKAKNLLAPRGKAKRKSPGGA